MYASDAMESHRGRQDGQAQNRGKWGGHVGPSLRLGCAQTNGGGGKRVFCITIIRIPVHFESHKSLEGDPMLIDLNDPHLENKLLAQEQVYNQLRSTGEEAPAKILSLTDTGIRIGEEATMLQFYVEVFPEELPSFNATTQQAVSDASRPKFAPGQTIYVKYDPKNPKQVAVDHTPVEPPLSVIVCQFCGATQPLAAGQSACGYCGRPLSA